MKLMRTARTGCSRWLPASPFRLLLWLFLAAVPSAHGGGPRFVTGPPFFQTSGRAVGWRQPSLLFFTDPGDLSASVTHTSADALVLAAAAVWNVPNAGITVGAGGVLAEHVSSANVFSDAAGLHWPADVLASNAASIPVAILYDNDGSVTETLLGAGASDPSSCAQNAATESVDAFDPAGFILHAIVVVNGRCAGPDPQAEIELQYQLMRVFGRILGLAWSQTNDNVFTGKPTPTYDQALHWPVMHPIDIRCGPFSYQCMPDPFRLRPDDLAALIAVYPVTGTPPPGKAVSLADGNMVRGVLSFPSGQGMAGVNVLASRQMSSSTAPEGWVESSAVTGAYFERSGTSPFGVALGGAPGSEGSLDATLEGFYLVPYLPVSGTNNNDTVLVGTEPVNPLYRGAYSLGPYAAGVVSPAGSSPVPFGQTLVRPGATVEASFRITDAPQACGTGTDGSAALPGVAPPSGWWNGQICGFGHAAYLAAPVRAGHSFTFEVTALDESGEATTGKLMPAIGVFPGTAGVPGQTPFAAQATAFNSLCMGMTTLRTTLAEGEGITLGVADERGAGRPDFSYQARLFYADSLSPATLPDTGGNVTLTGMGFRFGNKVLVNGVSASVTSWTSNTIVLVAPALLVTGASAGTPVDVQVEDGVTGATTTISGALTYRGTAPAPAELNLTSAPASANGSGIFVGTPSAVPFAVQVLAGDTRTPLGGQSVTFSVASGSAGFAACSGAPLCTLFSDSRGMASSAVTATSAGLVLLAATSAGTSLNSSVVAGLQPTTMLVLSVPQSPAVVGKQAAGIFQVEVLRNGNPIAGDAVTFSVAPGSAANATLGRCAAASCTVVSDSAGRAGVAVTANLPGTLTLAATEPGGLSQQISLPVTGAPNSLQLVTPAAVTGYVNQTAASTTVLVVGADGVTPVRDQLVTFHADPGLTLQCGAEICPLYSDAFGHVATNARAASPGIYHLDATSAGATPVSTTYNLQALPPAQLTINSLPGSPLVLGSVTATPFSVRLGNGFGAPLPGVIVTLSGATGSVLLGCGFASCSGPTDSNGVFSTTVKPLAGGTLVLSAVALDVAAIQASLNVSPGAASLAVVAAPPAVVSVGTQVQFTLRLLGADQLPIGGWTVWASLSGGSLAVPSCALAVCKLYTDANGYVTVAGKVWTTGPVTILMSTDGLIAQTTFNVVSGQPSMKLVSLPSPRITSGMSAGTFTVQMVAGDGVTPLPGQNVTFGLSSGSAVLAACPAQAPCVVATDPNGLASTGTLTGGSAGTVTLVASSGASQQTVSFLVSGNGGAVSALQPQLFVAEQTSLPLQLDVNATLNGQPAGGATIAWTGTGPVRLAGTFSVTDASGQSSAEAAVGPLAASSTSTINACAWTSVCAAFHLTGVPASQWRLLLVSGGEQTVDSGSPFAPVVAQVSDLSGHPVLGAPVSVGETVTAFHEACPATGRCPAAPILASEILVLRTDAKGQISFSPLDVPAQATQTEVALSTGTQAFLTTVLSSSSPTK